jgi:hypothetical protein
MMAEPGSLYCAKHQSKTRRKRRKPAKVNRVDPLD